jgi:hypothetical protein
MAAQATRIWAMVVAEEHDRQLPVLERLHGDGVAAFVVAGAHGALGALRTLRPHAVVVCLDRSPEERYELIGAMRRDPCATGVSAVVLAPPAESEPLLQAGYDGVAAVENVSSVVRSLMAHTPRSPA